MSNTKENKQFIILRHVSGAGSSTFARFLVDTIPNSEYFEADMWMRNENDEYEFRAEKLHYCHSKCFDAVKTAMEKGIQVVILSNTSTREKEIAHYIDLARQFDYKVVSLVVENRNNTKDIHNLPPETRENQARNIRNNLKLL